MTTESNETNADTVAERRRFVYIVFLTIALLIWLSNGTFVAVEAPYVGF